MTSTGFGWVVYNGKKYDSDILVTASGQVIARNEEELRAKYKTSHVIDKSEIETLLKENPRMIIFGTGQTGLARLSKESRELLMKTTVMIAECPTPEAVKRFDMAKGTKAAIFHVTC